jgi:hypothetical protein
LYSVGDADPEEDAVAELRPGLLPERHLRLEHRALRDVDAPDDAAHGMCKDAALALAVDGHVDDVERIGELRHARALFGLGKQLDEIHGRCGSPEEEERRKYQDQDDRGGNEQSA